MDKLMVLQSELEEIEAQIATMQAFPATLDLEAVVAVRRRGHLLGEAIEDLADAGQSMQLARSTRMIRMRLRLSLDRLPEV